MEAILRKLYRFLLNNLAIGSVVFLFFLISLFYNILLETVGLDILNLSLMIFIGYSLITFGSVYVKNFKSVEGDFLSKLLIGSLKMIRDVFLGSLFGIVLFVVFSYYIMTFGGLMQSSR